MVYFTTDLVELISKIKKPSGYAMEPVAYSSNQTDIHCSLQIVERQLFCMPKEIKILLLYSVLIWIIVSKILIVLNTKYCTCLHRNLFASMLGKGHHREYREPEQHVDSAPVHPSVEKEIESHTFCRSRHSTSCGRTSSIPSVLWQGQLPHREDGKHTAFIGRARSALVTHRGTSGGFF